MRGIEEDDVVLSHWGITTNNNDSSSITRMHHPLKNLRHYVLKHNIFYIHPGNEKKNSPDLYNSSRDYSKAMKTIFQEAITKDGGSLNHGNNTQWPKCTCSSPWAPYWT